jgi:hypothetical protein
MVRMSLKEEPPNPKLDPFGCPQGWEALPLVRYEVADVNVYMEEDPNALPLLP